METSSTQIRLEPSWKAHLSPEFQSDRMVRLRSFLQSEIAAGKTVFPPPGLFFSALNIVPFDSVKVVILGQDPYHGPGQAHGLSFSVRDGVRPPPSLLNIYKELHADLGCPIPKTGDLTPWAEQGVLLLNSVLSVLANSPGSHRNRGWEQFTDRIIALLSEQRENLVFMLWGAYAQSKIPLINAQRHCILKAPHPSPLSAHAGFFGCKHFSKANQYLDEHGLSPIHWTL